MRRMVLLTLLGLSALLVTTPRVLTHHALHSEYDTARRGQFRGILTRFALINPHVRWFFDVKGPNGTITKWEVTGAGPQALRANGMTRIFKVGDTYDVVYAPARDGSNLGRVVNFKFPDGRVVTLFHEDPNNPLNK